MGCEVNDKDGNRDIVGSDEVYEISDLFFTIGNKVVTNTQMTVEGIVTNIGTTIISPQWYIEGMFYSDTNFTTILGGATTNVINIPLEPDVSYNWELSFESYNIDESTFPYFGIKNLRGYHEESQSSIEH